MAAPERSARRARAMVPDSVAVVGAGLAGSYAVAGLRRRGFTGRVVLVGAEAHRPYDRPPLSKRVLAGGETTRLEDDLGVALEDLCDVVRLGQPAEYLEATAAGACLRGGDWEEAADAVLLACGAAPVVPAGWEGVTMLRTLDDAVRLRAALTSRTRLVVVGAGWIGAEVAGAAAGAGCEVTVVEALAAPLARELGAAAGALTARWHAEAGVRLLTGRRVVAARGDRVVLDDGERLAADVVLVAAGVRPDVAWLGRLGGAAGAQGVRVGTDLRVAGPCGQRLLAVGDCAVRWSSRYRSWIAGGHWEEAMLAGDAAAACLVDVPVRHDPPRYVFSTQFGRELGLVGRADPAARLVLRGDPASPGGWAVAWLRAEDDGERLVALLTVDRPRDLAAFRRALGSAPGDGVLVDPAVLADITAPARAALRGP